MSPILTRPIREQLEHDRIIRQLQARFKRKHEVAINPGPEQNESVTVGDLSVFPDLLLFSQDRSRRLEGTIEVETGESVNQLEALAEWGVFSKLKAPFYLYVPPQSIDSARRICDEHQFPVAEIWTYHLALDQVRFTQVYRSPNAPKPAPPPKASEKPAASRPVAANPKAAKAKAPVPKVPAARTPAAKASAPKSPAKAVKPARPASKPVKSVKAAAKAKAATPVKAKAGAKPAKPAAKAKSAKKRR